MKSITRSCLDCVARWYFSSFPVERGKWALWCRFLPYRCREPKTVECPAGRGLRMRVRLEDYIGNFIYYWGCWEPDESWVIRTLLRPGDVFIDVGANVGYFSLLAASIVGPSGRVIAFEATPPTLEELRHNVALNGLQNVDIRGEAVLDRECVVTISQPHDANTGANSIRFQPGNSPSWQVSAVPLAAVLPAEVPVRLLKVDVEGADLHVLRGFEQRLRGADAPFVLCEVADTFLRHMGGSSNELMALMAELGYRAYFCSRGRLTPTTPEAVACIDSPNVVFSKVPLSTRGHPMEGGGAPASLGARQTP
jgi:FkbM family methyltransferase